MYWCWLPKSITKRKHQEIFREENKMALLLNMQRKNLYCKHLHVWVCIPFCTVLIVSIVWNGSYNLTSFLFSPPSARQCSSYDDCPEIKREYYQNCSVLDCVNQCSQQHTYMSRCTGWYVTVIWLTTTSRHLFFWKVQIKNPLQLWVEIVFAWLIEHLSYTPCFINLDFSAFMR